MWAGTHWEGLTGMLGALGPGDGASSISVLSDKHHQCPGPSTLPWTFLHQWSGLSAGTTPGPQRPGSKGEHDLGTGDINGLGVQQAEPPPPGSLLVLCLLGPLHDAASPRHHPHLHLLLCRPFSHLGQFSAGLWIWELMVPGTERRAQSSHTGRESSE